MREILNKKGELSKMDSILEELSGMMMSGKATPFSQADPKAIEWIRSLFGENLFLRIKDQMKRKKRKTVGSRKSMIRKSTIGGGPRMKERIQEVLRIIRDADGDKDASDVLSKVRTMIEQLVFASQKRHTVNGTISEIGSDMNESFEQVFGHKPDVALPGIGSNKSNDTMEFSQFEFDPSPFGNKRVADLQSKVEAAEKKQEAMKNFIDKLMSSYKKHKHMAKAIEFDLGINEELLTEINNEDFLQMARSQAKLVEAMKDNRRS